MSITWRGSTDTASAITTAKAISDEIRLDGKGTDLVLTITNTSANALTDFQLRVKSTPEDTFGQLVHNSGWQTLNNHLIAYQGTLNTLAGGATGRAHVKLGPWHSIQFWASAGTAASTTLRINVRCEG